MGELKLLLLIAVFVSGVYVWHKFKQKVAGFKLPTVKVPWGKKTDEIDDERIPTPPGFRKTNPIETTYQTTSDLQWLGFQSLERRIDHKEKNGYVYVRKLNPDGKTAWKLKIKPPDL